MLKATQKGLLQDKVLGNMAHLAYALQTVLMVSYIPYLFTAVLFLWQKKPAVLSGFIYYR
jgi:hypothetical protein